MAEKLTRAEIDAIVARRFGPSHEKPCERPTILTCAMWECQVQDRCRYTSPSPLPETKGIAAA